MLEEKRPVGNVDSLKKLNDSLTNFKKKAKMFELSKVKNEIIEQAAEAKRKDLNMSVEQWKYKYLYPFGNIAPVKDSANDIGNQQ